MNEEIQLMIKEQLPAQLKLDGITDYTENQVCKVRGLIGKNAIVIVWNYEHDPENVHLSAIDLKGEERQGPLPLKDLKRILNTLI
jgi:hypothetical protein